MPASPAHARRLPIKSTLHTDKRSTTQDALRDSEARFRTLAETAPVVVWMTSPDVRCTYISAYWRELTGRDPKKDLGLGWVEALHPDDRERAAHDLIEASRTRTHCRGEYRVKRADGEYGWLLDHGVPYFHADGSYAGHIGTCMDITEHKRQQLAGHEVKNSLVLGQEAERKRVAKELHDDISQRLALVALELTEVEHLVGRTPTVPREKFKTLRQRVDAIAQDIHRISHNLHPSTLVHLGLVSALRALCRDFSEQTRITVEFTHEISSVPPQDVAIAIYRVTQECLNNVARHSGSRQAHVSVVESANGLELTITDAGVGFDTTQLSSGDGLGLVSIRERARMIGAQIHIGSGLGRGTTIKLRMPCAERRGV